MPRPAFAGRRVTSLFTTEIIEARDLARVRSDWCDLFDRSVECNVFYGPDMLEPLATGPLGESSFRVMLAWRGAGSIRRLAGFMPITLAATPLAAVRGFQHHYVVGSIPLIDAENSAEVACALMDGLAEARPGALLILDDVRLDWPAWRVFREAAEATDRAYEEGDEVFRAAVAPASSAAHVKGKIAQNLRRCEGRLAKFGAWSVTMPDDTARARQGLEALLTLEASGWKGAAGTALANNPETLEFARKAFDPGNLRPKPLFSVLELDGRPIAVSMHLAGTDNAANLKCAYDEEYAACSPGVVLDAAVANDLRREAFTPMLDSVAKPGHPVERLWPERLRCGWVAVGCDPGMGLTAFQCRLAIERLQRSMRRIAVNTYASAAPALRKAFWRD